MFDLLLTSAVLILEPRGAAKHRIYFRVYYVLGSSVLFLCFQDVPLSRGRLPACAPAGNQVISWQFKEAHSCSWLLGSFVVVLLVYVALFFFMWNCGYFSGCWMTLPRLLGNVWKSGFWAISCWAWARERLDCWYFWNMFFFFSIRRTLPVHPIKGCVLAPQNASVSAFGFSRPRYITLSFPMTIHWLSMSQR